MDSGNVSILLRICVSQLGTTLPAPINVARGNLCLSSNGFFTRFIFTHVSIRTSDTSSMPYSTPSQAYRTLLYHARKLASAASVHGLSPVESSAQADSISELLQIGRASCRERFELSEVGG